ncbi:MULTISPECIES: S8 family serine peptidase [Clostridium]|uniref:S8/S53 family peptidase n=1 Tax=Clostridium cibarium TaxID=2762247 RepID=A0ABR8PYZ5_9CLOT|nr:MULTISPECIES: S8 family serine peptidase [Clostridium]MBD7913393.1 S8/S53 family peptidase [Clostridium cibarium]
MKSKLKKVLIAISIFVMIVSITYNVLLILKVNKKTWNIAFENANSRDTYFSIHNVKQAQSIGKGKGIKVGILDHCFGYELHKDLYSGGVDFLNSPYALNKSNEHGYWMASTLKEIAPECEVYALNTAASMDEDKRVTAMIDAIDWAIENHIDILTYSQSPISDKNRKRFDDAVNKAVENNIVTTFIHYDNPNNIWPGQMVDPKYMEKGQREPDFSILQYDYNTLRIDTYDKYQKLKSNIRSGDDIPYYSVSSTSPVTAGFIAILKSINNKLTTDEYRQILKKTVYKTTFTDPFTLKKAECSNVVDIGKAATFIKENY